MMASLFHDFAFSDPELARVSTKQQLEDMHLEPSDEKYQAIKSHPARGCQIIKGLHEVPADVDIIVLQHHERPDGSGFPKGLRAQQIAPLAAVMIVAHDILDHMLKQRDFELKDFLSIKEADYSQGPFRKIWKALSVAESAASGTPAA